VWTVHDVSSPSISSVNRPTLTSYVVFASTHTNHAPPPAHLLLHIVSVSETAPITKWTWTIGALQKSAKC